MILLTGFPAAGKRITAAAKVVAPAAAALCIDAGSHPALRARNLPLLKRSIIIYNHHVVSRLCLLMRIVTEAFRFTAQILRAGAKAARAEADAGG